jgi:hypothetical protein
MVVLVLPVMVVVELAAAIGPAFGLKGRFNLQQLGSEPNKHVFDYMVGPNKKNISSNFGRQVPIAQVPGKTRQLVTVCMADLYKWFGSGSDPQPIAVIE